MKKQFYLTLDVETANSTEYPLCYDIGFAVTDRNGEIYETYSFVNTDIFDYEKDLMDTAYYHQKLPRYYVDLEKGTRKKATTAYIKKCIADLIKKYDITAVCAYNAYFDSNALNVTQRYVTKSKYRYFLPYGTKIFDIWHMACQVICTKKSYYNFCIDNNLVSKSGNISTNAESVYRYLTKNETFSESHTGLEDVLIENEIMKMCYKAHKKMNKNINRACWRIPQRKRVAVSA